MKNNVHYENKLSLMESNYPGQFPEQMPIYLVCDWQNGEIYTRTREYTISGTSFDEFYGHERFFSLPYTVDAVELKDYVEEKVLPVANEIEKHYESKWNGNNHVANFGELEESDAQLGFPKLDKLMGKIERLCEDAPCHNGGFMNAGDYFVDGIEAVHINMTEEAIEELAEKLEVWARDEDDVILYGTEELINSMIEEMEDADEN